MRHSIFARNTGAKSFSRHPATRWNGRDLRSPPRARAWCSRNEHQPDTFLHCVPHHSISAPFPQSHTFFHISSIVSCPIYFIMFQFLTVDLKCLIITHFIINVHSPRCLHVSMPVYPSMSVTRSPCCRIHVQHFISFLSSFSGHLVSSLQSLKHHLSRSSCTVFFAFLHRAGPLNIFVTYPT